MVQVVKVVEPEYCRTKAKVLDLYPRLGRQLARNHMDCQLADWVRALRTRKACQNMIWIH
jgi:hypothetical protein